MMAQASKLPISPLVGEMPGKAEGSAVPPSFPHATASYFVQQRSTLPPSGLPAISPTRGEIAGCEVD